MLLPIVAPKLATAGRVTGDPSRWAAQVKWDGWRAVVSVDGTVKVRNRLGREVSESLPELAGLADAVGGRPAILDGELVTSTRGAVDLNRLSARMSAMRAWSPSGSTRSSGQVSGPDGG